MENIMIIIEESSFREGLKKLIEIKFGHFFRIIGTDTKKIERYQKEPPPRLIIIEKIANTKTEQFLVEMRKQGTKVVLLSLEPQNIQDFAQLNIFDGFLLKKMPTKHLLSILEEIMEQDNVYVHPDIGYHLLKKLNEKGKKHLQTV